jgi:hypothetical protein
MKYIGDMAIKMKNNCLVLFGDIKGGYGKKLYEYIKSNSDKNVYYIDGGTPSDNREFYKQQCEEDLTGKTILVASIGTFQRRFEAAPRRNADECSIDVEEYIEADRKEEEEAANEEW